MQVSLHLCRHLLSAGADDSLSMTEKAVVYRNTSRFTSAAGATEIELRTSQHLRHFIEQLEILGSWLIL